MKTKLFITCTLCLICPLSLLFSQAAYISTLTADAGSTGLAGTNTATPGTYDAVFENTAALSFSDYKVSAGLSYKNLYKRQNQTTFLSQVSGYYRINKLLVIGGGIKYLDEGEVTFLVNSGINTPETVHLNEMEAAAGVGIKLAEHWAVSVDLKMLRQNQGDFVFYDINYNPVKIHPGISPAADLGIYYKKNTDTVKNKIISAGVTINNLGPKLELAEGSGDYLAANMKIGIGYAFDVHEKSNIGIYADITKFLTPYFDTADGNQNDIFDVIEYSVPESIVGSFGDSPDGITGEIREMNVSLGLTYTYNKTLSLRSGIYLTKDKGDNFVTFGAGYRYRFVEASIAYLEYLEEESDYLDYDHKFVLSLNFNFGQI